MVTCSSKGGVLGIINSEEEGLATLLTLEADLGRLCTNEKYGTFWDWSPLTILCTVS